MLELVSRLPLTVLYALSSALAALACQVFRYRRAHIVASLELAFPDHTPAAIRAIARECYRYQADLLVETLCARHLSAEEIGRRVEIVNPECVRAHLSRGQPVILIGGHQGNWEWDTLAFGRVFEAPLEVIYKPLHSARFDDFMRATRSRFGARPIPAREALIEIMKRKREPRMLTLLADQNPERKGEHTWVDFLNRPTAFGAGCEMIARLTRYPVIFMRRHRVGRGRYRLTFVPVAEPPYAKQGFEVTARYARVLEDSIREHPAEWLWLHRRWKHERPLYS